MNGPFGKLAFCVFKWWYCSFGFVIVIDIHIDKFIVANSFELKACELGLKYGLIFPLCYLVELLLKFDFIGEYIFFSLTNHAQFDEWVMTTAKLIHLLFNQDVSSILNLCYGINHVGTFICNSNVEHFEMVSQATRSS